jgi:hypothetical protein
MINNDLTLNIDKIHITELGIERIRKNFDLDITDVVKWCKNKIKDPNCHISRKGKNWYATISNYVITVNAYSYTIITAHKE